MSLSAKEKTGKLKPLDPTKVAPAIRLVSSATYVRTRVEDTSGVPMNSTYRATLADPAANSADMLARCVATRGEVRRHDMVRAAARLIAPATLDAFEEDAARTFAAETRAREAQLAMEGTRSAGRGVALMTPALAAFSQVLAAEPRHPASATMVNQFFSAGSADGPFPGSKSEMGSVLAGAYWVDMPANSKLVMGPRLPHHGPDGNRLWVLRARTRACARAAGPRAGPRAADFARVRVRALRHLRGRSTRFRSRTPLTSRPLPLSLLM